MFPLHRRSLPTSKDELAIAVEEGLRRFVHKSGPIVDVRSGVFPCIQEIVINLDNAEVDAFPPRPEAVAGGTKPAFEVTVINLTARNISLRGMPANLEFEARSVCLDQAFDARGEILLLPRGICNGEISFSAAQVDLEEAITRIVAAEARAHGITIEQVRLALRERGPRSLAGKVQIQARKFVRANIDIYGQLDVDENFVATISQLRCQGAGVIASRACSALEPHLQRFNGRSFPLKSLPLGETQLRTLRIAVSDTLELRLGFGSAKAQT